MTRGIFDAVAGWVIGGARWVLAAVFGAIDTLSRPNLDSAWFGRHVGVMAGIAAGWLGLLFIVAVIDAGVRRHADGLIRAVTMLPVAAVATPIVMFMLDLAIVATDQASGWLMSLAGADLTEFSERVTSALLQIDVDGAAAFGLVAAFFVMIAAAVVWIELLMREAAVYTAALFLPLAFAGIVWPATSHWAGRLLRLEGALVASKLVITAVTSLGATMALEGGAEDGLSAVLVGLGTLILAAYAPFVLYRIVQVWDAEAAGGFQGALTGAVGRALAPAATAVGVAGAARLLTRGGTAAPLVTSSSASPAPPSPPPADGGPAMNGGGS